MPCGRVSQPQELKDAGPTIKPRIPSLTGADPRLSQSEGWTGTRGGHGSLRMPESGSRLQLVTRGTAGPWERGASTRSAGEEPGTWTWACGGAGTSEMAQGEPKSLRPTRDFVVLVLHCDFEHMFIADRTCGAVLHFFRTSGRPR